jgi:signal recognition particle subunit SRP54
LQDFKDHGKTSTVGKIANLLRKQGKNPLMVACDIYRPAAIKQLQIIGNQLNIRCICK